MTPDPLRGTLKRIDAMGAELKVLLARHETSSSRIITLEQSRARLGTLSLAQDELLGEALRAAELGLFRAAHVLVWAGFVDFLHEYLWRYHRSAIVAARPAWNLTSAQDLRDQTEYAVVEAGKVSGAYSKTVMKALHGLLNKRNECAHPSDYLPDLNGTLGYVSDVFGRIEFLLGKRTHDGSVERP